MNHSQVLAIAQAAANKEVRTAFKNIVEASVVTEDATPTIAVTIELNDYEGGFIEVEVIAVTDSGTGKFSGKSIVGVFKDAALTLDTPDILHVADSIGAAYSVVDDSDNPAVQIIGVVGTTINWIVAVKKLVTQATSIP